MSTRQTRQPGSAASAKAKPAKSAPGAAPPAPEAAPPPTANQALHECVEHSIWTAVPSAPPSELRRFTLRLRDVHPREYERIKAAGAMSFHLTGCAGEFADHAPQRAVARAMARQARDPALGGAAHSAARKASFFYHLGDIVYKDEVNGDDPVGDDQRAMYNEQFYAPYSDYPRRIFAVAGNHDGKVTSDPATCAIEHFLANFCAVGAPVGRRAPDNRTDTRAAMVQPYVYWRLTTPLAYIIGLYTNIANGGMLDDPASPDVRAQYDWLVAQLRDVARRNTRNTPRKAVLLAVHYPPYSGTSNFAQRADPTLGPSNATKAVPLAEVLRQAFEESGQRPDAVFSAHAHLYERLTQRFADGWELPYLVVGSGGHGPVESMWKQCDGTKGAPRQVPFDAVLPPGHTLPPDQSVRVVAFDDESFGFVRMTLGGHTLTGEFFAAHPGPLKLADAFTLDLEKHTIR